MIHSSAIIDPKATIADDVEIGPWTLIGPDVEIGPGTWVGPHVVIKGPTRIGKNNKIYQFCSIGEDPQDIKYHNEPTRLEIGDSNFFREGVTVHRGTPEGRSLTKIGSHNMFMMASHVAHDCEVGDNCVFSNYAALAGHVTLGDFVILSAYSAVHQYCHVGDHSFIARATLAIKDVPPYMVVAGNPATACQINTTGLKRRGYTSDSINGLRRAYKVLYRSGFTVDEALPQLRDMEPDCPEVGLLIKSLEQSGRGIIR